MSAELHRIKWAARSPWRHLYIDTWKKTHTTGKKKTRRENKAWAGGLRWRSPSGPAIWTFAPLPSTKWASSAGDASSGRGKFSFPCIKKAGSPAVFEVLAVEAFPLLRNLTQNPLRGSCQHRLPGNRLLFSLCFQVQVGASWASLSAAPAKWAYESFRSNVNHEHNSWNRMIGIKKGFFFAFSYLFTSFHCPYLNLSLTAI